MLLAGYVHDSEDFYPDQANNRWARYPYVVELLSTIPPHSPIIHAVLGPFATTMGDELELWYKTSPMLHTALEIWGELDMTVSPVGFVSCVHCRHLLRVWSK
jgi:hypothetical protein